MLGMVKVTCSTYASLIGFCADSCTSRHRHALERTPKAIRIIPIFRDTEPDAIIRRPSRKPFSHSVLGFGCPWSLSRQLGILSNCDSRNRRGFSVIAFQRRRDTVDVALIDYDLETEQASQFLEDARGNLVQTEAIPQSITLADCIMNIPRVSQENATGASTNTAGEVRCRWLPMCTMRTDWPLRSARRKHVSEFEGREAGQCCKARRFPIERRRS